MLPIRGVRNGVVLLWAGRVADDSPPPPVVYGQWSVNRFQPVRVRPRSMLQTLGHVSSLLLGTLILVVGNSLLGIVLPVRMGLEHVPEFLSGLVMSAFYLGFVLGSARIQVLIRRAGHIRAFAALAAILTACAM